MEKQEQAHDTRPRYKGVCEACQGDLYICKSIAQEAGIYVLGHGTCPKCGAFLHLVFNKDRQEFECETWENFIEKMKGERQNGNGHERL